MAVSEVPLEVQQWMFEELAETKMMDLNILVHKLWPRLLAVARQRHMNGYLLWGDQMYKWTSEERLNNVIEELADAVAYMTSGPLGPEVEDLD